MSPLFGHDDDDQQLPRAFQLGAQLDDAVKHIASLPLEQFASQVMTQFFNSPYEPGGGTVGIGDVTDGLMPPHDFAKLGDPTPEAQLVLEDLVGEAVQVLEHAGLIRPKAYYSGNVSNFAYVATRRGRSALEKNAVESALTGSTA